MNLIPYPFLDNVPNRGEYSSKHVKIFSIPLSRRGNGIYKIKNLSIFNALKVNKGHTNIILNAKRVEMRDDDCPEHFFLWLFSVSHRV